MHLQGLLEAPGRLRRVESGAQRGSEEPDGGILHGAWLRLAELQWKTGQTPAVGRRGVTRGWQWPPESPWRPHEVRMDAIAQSKPGAFRILNYLCNYMK